MVSLEVKGAPLSTRLALSAALVVALVIWSTALLAALVVWSMALVAAVLASRRTDWDLYLSSS